MRSRVAVMTLAVAASTFAVPLLAHAASIPFFGPIIDPAWLDPSSKTCALGWGALILVINNLIRFLLTIVIVFIAPLVIAYAGFLLVVNSVHPAGKEQAKHMIQNLIVGLVIALAGWLIVDLIMSVLYNGAFGSWSTIITTGGADPCLKLATNLNPAPGGATGTGAPSGTGTGGTGGLTTGRSGSLSGTGGTCTVLNSGACSTSNLAIFGAAASQASQICSAESSNGTRQFGDYIAPPSADAGSPVSFGLFQINISANDVNNLGCPKAFSGIYTGSNKSITIRDQVLYTRCQFAALDPATNIATAYAIYQAGWKGVKPSFGAWSSASGCGIAFASSPVLAKACEIITSFI